jgi:hypothetical protein
MASVTTSEPSAHLERRCEGTEVYDASGKNIGEVDHPMIDKLSAESVRRDELMASRGRSQSLPCAGAPSWTHRLSASATISLSSSARMRLSSGDWVD